MNKKRLLICITSIVSIFIIGSIILYIIQKNDYSNYMLIKTEESYYKVNKYLKSKKIDNNEFIEANNKIYSITDCFESYIDHDKNEVLNRILSNYESFNYILHAEVLAYQDAELN